MARRVPSDKLAEKYGRTLGPGARGDIEDPGAKSAKDDPPVDPPPEEPSRAPVRRAATPEPQGEEDQDA